MNFTNFKLRVNEFFLSSAGRYGEKRKYAETLEKGTEIFEKSRKTDHGRTVITNDEDQVGRWKSVSDSKVHVKSRRSVSSEENHKDEIAVNNGKADCHRISVANRNVQRKTVVKKNCIDCWKPITNRDDYDIQKSVANERINGDCWKSFTNGENHAVHCKSFIYGEDCEGHCRSIANGEDHVDQYKSVVNRDHEGQYMSIPIHTDDCQMSLVNENGPDECCTSVAISIDKPCLPPSSDIHLSPNNDKHISSSNDKHHSSSSDKHQSSSNDKHQNSSNGKHRSSSNGKHQSSSNGKHQSSSKGTHQSFSNDTHQSSSNGTHQSPSNDKHISSSNDKHQNFSNDRHRNSSTGTCRSSSNDKHQTSSNVKHQSPSTVKHQSPSYDKNISSSNDQHRSSNNDKKGISSTITRQSSCNDKHRSPSIDKHQIPSFDKYRSLNIDEHQTPSIDAHQNPSIDTHQSPSIDTHQSPSIDTHQSPSTHQSPTIDTHQSPSIDGHQSPSIREHQSPNIDEPRHPSIDEPRRLNIDEPRHSSIGEHPQRLNIDEPRCPSIDEPQRLNIDEPRHSSIGEPQRLNIDEPRCPSIGEPQCLNIDEPRCPSIDEPRRLSIGESPRLSIDEPRRPSIDKLQHYSVHRHCSSRLVKSRRHSKCSVLGAYESSSKSNLALNRPVRRGVPKVFQLCTYNQQEMLVIHQMINKLGGRVISGEQSDPQTTHVCVRHIGVEEKIVAALVRGKWIVQTAYVTRSFKVGHWLWEEDFELGNSIMPYDTLLKDDLIDIPSIRYMYEAPRKCREAVVVRMRPLFSYWKKIGLVVDLESVRDSMWRILKAGGADVKVLSLPLEDNAPQQVEWVLAEVENISCLRPLVKQNIKCLPKGYMYDFLLRDPPPPMDAYSISECCRSVWSNVEKSLKWFKSQEDYSTSPALDDLQDRGGSFKSSNNDIGGSPSSERSGGYNCNIIFSPGESHVGPMDRLTPSQRNDNNGRDRSPIFYRSFDYDHGRRNLSPGGSNATAGNKFVKVVEPFRNSTNRSGVGNMSPCYSSNYKGVKGRLDMPYNGQKSFNHADRSVTFTPLCQGDQSCNSSSTQKEQITEDRNSRSYVRTGTPMHFGNDRTLLRSNDESMQMPAKREQPRNTRRGPVMPPISENIVSSTQSTMEDDIPSTLEVVPSTNSSSSLCSPKVLEGKVTPGMYSNEKVKSCDGTAQKRKWSKISDYFPPIKGDVHVSSTSPLQSQINSNKRQKMHKSSSPSKSRPRGSRSSKDRPTQTNTIIKHFSPQKHKEAIPSSMSNKEEMSFSSQSFPRESKVLLLRKSIEQIPSGECYALENLSAEKCIEVMSATEIATKMIVFAGKCVEERSSVEEVSSTGQCPEEISSDVYREDMVVSVETSTEVISTKETPTDKSSENKSCEVACEQLQDTPLVKEQSAVLERSASHLTSSDVVDLTTNDLDDDVNITEMVIVVKEQSTVEEKSACYRNSSDVVDLTINSLDEDLISTDVIDLISDEEVQITEFERNTLSRRSPAVSRCHTRTSEVIEIVDCESDEEITVIESSRDSTNSCQYTKPQPRNTGISIQSYSLSSDDDDELSITFIPATRKKRDKNSARSKRKNDCVTLVSTDDDEHTDELVRAASMISITDCSSNTSLGSWQADSSSRENSSDNQFARYESIVRDCSRMKLLLRRCNPVVSSASTNPEINAKNSNAKSLPFLSAPEECNEEKESSCNIVRSGAKGDKDCSKVSLSKYLAKDVPVRDRCRSKSVSCTNSTVVTDLENDTDNISNSKMVSSNYVTKSAELLNDNECMEWLNRDSDSNETIAEGFENSGNIISCPSTPHALVTDTIGVCSENRTQCQVGELPLSEVLLNTENISLRAVCHSSNSSFCYENEIGGSTEMQNSEEESNGDDLIMRSDVLRSLELPPIHNASEAQISQNDEISSFRISIPIDRLSHSALSPTISVSIPIQELQVSPSAAVNNNIFNSIQIGDNRDATMDIDRDDDSLYSLSTVCPNFESASSPDSSDAVCAKTSSLNVELESEYCDLLPQVGVSEIEDNTSAVCDNQLVGDMDTSSFIFDHDSSCSCRSVSCVSKHKNKGTETVNEGLRTRKKVTPDATRLIVSKRMYQNFDFPWKQLKIFNIPQCCDHPETCRLLHGKGKNTAQELEHAFSACLRSMLSFTLWPQALSLLRLTITPDFYPPMSDVRSICNFILNTHCRTLESTAMQSLKLLLRIHPPCAAGMGLYYKGIFIDAEIKNGHQVGAGLLSNILSKLDRELMLSRSQDHTTRSQMASANDEDDDSDLEPDVENDLEDLVHFDVLKSVDPSQSFFALSDSERLRRLLVLLGFVLDGMEQELLVWLVKHSHCPQKAIAHLSRRPMVAFALWGHDKHIGRFNRNLRHMVLLYLKCRDRGWMTLASELLRYLRMVALLVQMLDQREDNTFPHFGDNCESLAHNVAGLIMDSKLNPDERARVIAVLEPSWLSLNVCNNAIVRLSGILKELNLETMTQFVTSITHLLKEKSTQLMEEESNEWTTEESSLPSAQSKTKSVDQDKAENSTLVYPIHRSWRKNINKRDRKGEARIHTVCRNNRIEELHKLLATPGIDVNVQDNLGWTPLHEAARHGNEKCVEALLQYKPMPGSIGVNPRLKSLGGITPLIDALDINNLRIIELLIQYGGKDLLLDKVNGKSILEVSDKPEVRAILERASGDCVFNPMQYLPRSILKEISLLLPTMVQSYLRVYNVLPITLDLVKISKSLEKVEKPSREGRRNLSFDVFRYTRDFNHFQNLKTTIKNLQHTEDTELIRALSVYSYS